MARLEDIHGHSEELSTCGDGRFRPTRMLGYEAELVFFVVDRHNLISATTGMIAVRYCRAGRDTGREIGSDIAVAGAGDIDVCGYATPVLSPLNLYLQALGYRTGKAIFDDTVTDGKAVRTHPVIRQSVPLVSR